MAIYGDDRRHGGIFAHKAYHSLLFVMTVKNINIGIQLIWNVQNEEKQRLSLTQNKHFLVHTTLTNISSLVSVFFFVCMYVNNNKKEPFYTEFRNSQNK